MGLTPREVNSSNLYRFEQGYRGSSWPVSPTTSTFNATFTPGARAISSYGYRPLPVTPVSLHRPTVSLRTLKMPNGRPITMPQPQHGRGAVPFHDLCERPPAILVGMQATRYVELDADRSPLRYAPASLMKTRAFSPACRITLPAFPLALKQTIQSPRVNGTISLRRCGRQDVGPLRAL